MFVNCLDCGEIFNNFGKGQAVRCPDCQNRREKAAKEKIVQHFLNDPAKDKDIAMWGWQSLDRQTKVSYSRYLHGYFVDVIAPDRYFGHWRIHETEEEAGATVAALYDQFVAKDRGASWK